MKGKGWVVGSNSVVLNISNTHLLRNCFKKIVPVGLLGLKIIKMIQSLNSLPSPLKIKPPSSYNLYPFTITLSPSPPHLQLSHLMSLQISLCQKISWIFLSKVVFGFPISGTLLFKMWKSTPHFFCLILMWVHFNITCC